MTPAVESWDTRIQRAHELALQVDATQEILTFYESLLKSQKAIDEFLRTRRGWLPSGSLVEDLPIIRESLPTLLETVAVSGPATLSEEARRLMSADARSIDQMLQLYWRTPSDTQFFAKAFLQPYMRWLAETGGKPADRSIEQNERRCPFCSGNPQVSFLRIIEPSSESGNRELVCATCTGNWPFRRVACAFCGEERPTKLGYFHTSEYDHIRIEACDTCKHYVKGVDLTRLGYANPLVDEVAAAALDVWADNHGYTKIELNLVGL